MLSYDTIKRVAACYGLTLDDIACADLLSGSFEGETVGAALADYLNAYEGVADKTIDAILNDKDAGLTA